MWEIIKAAGWPIWPLIFASIIALAIIGERFWALRADIIAPKNLLPEVQKWLSQGGITKETCARLEQHSLLGEIFASALNNVNSSREVMKEAIEESGRAVAHKLDKYLKKLCAKERILDVIYNGVIFDAGRKKLPRPHQYFALKEAQNFIRQDEGGIIWHTQGSGKSILMIILAKWI